MNSAIIEDLPPAQRLALVYAPARARLPNLALLALDARLAGILRKRGEPLLVQVKLAWWRDLLGTPAQEWPRADPVLDLLRQWQHPASLAPLVDGWEALLAEDLALPGIAAFIDGRGAAFSALAQELGAAQPDAARSAGRLWAAADLAANLSAGAEREQVVAHSRTLPCPPVLPSSLRPLAVLAGLSPAALVRGGVPLLTGPRSVLTALRIGFTGR